MSVVVPAVAFNAVSFTMPSVGTLSLERIHFGVQGTRTGSQIQSDREAGRVPRDSLLAVVLARGGTGRAAAFEYRRWPNP
jgi:hypothetical protein